MDLETFKKTFGTPYRDKYGKYAMGDETAQMWHDKLKSEDFDKLKTVFHELLGSKERSFGWKAVLMLLDSRFPPEDAQAALEKQWKEGPKNDDEKQKEIGSYLRGLMREDKEARRTGAEFDWVKKYVKKHVDVYGPEETRKQAERFAYGNPVEKRFYAAAREILR